MVILLVRTKRATFDGWIGFKWNIRNNLMID